MKELIGFVTKVSRNCVILMNDFVSKKCSFQALVLWTYIDIYTIHIHAYSHMCDSFSFVTELFHAPMRPIQSIFPLSLA